MSDKDKTVRENFPHAARSTTGLVELEQFVTSGGTIFLRNPEIVR